MKAPSIRHARELCKKLGSQAVIILAFDSDSFAGASYALTERMCKQTGRTLDEIIDAIDGERISVWVMPEGVA